VLAWTGQHTTYCVLFIFCPLYVVLYRKISALLRDHQVLDGQFSSTRSEKAGMDGELTEYVAVLFGLLGNVIALS